MKPRSPNLRTRVNRTRVPVSTDRQDGSPPVATRTRVEHQPAMCERCGAVYERKTWRAGDRMQQVDLEKVTWTQCPACAQVADGEYFGRVRVMTPLTPDRELEVRRRIWNVEKRARYTQPERRLVRIEAARDGLEVLVTSQKLAHRIARELEKAFGGQTHFVWTDREGGLDVTWTPLDKPARKPLDKPARKPLDKLARKPLDKPARRIAQPATSRGGRARGAASRHRGLSSTTSPTVSPTRHRP